MSWISNIFKRKEKVSTSGAKAKKADKAKQTATSSVAKTIKDATKKTELVSYGGEIEPAIIIANRFPEYYKNLHIILDNGHGEETPGKRSPDGRFREYRFNREMVAMIANKLEQLGISYSILVPETKDISLAERVKRANAIHAEMHKQGKLTILISVHANAAGRGGWLNARGWCAYTSVGVTESDKLSACFYEAAHEILDPQGLKIRSDRSDGDEDQESNFYIIYKSSMPAVLTENFFQDNKQDVEYLESESGRNDVCAIHINAIRKYADLKFKK